MRIKHPFVITMFLISSLAYAQELTISELINQIKHSKGDIKRQKMNLLKIKLRSANRQTRYNAIAKIQNSMKANNSLNNNQTKATKETTTINNKPREIKQPTSNKTNNRRRHQRGNGCKHKYNNKLIRRNH